MKSSRKNILEHRVFETLKEQLERGVLAPLPHVRLRAQLAFADAENARDIVRAALVLIGRVRQYYAAVEYCGPRGGLKFERPTASAAKITRYYGGFYRQTYTVTLASEGPSVVWSKAGAICLETAFIVAEWEITQSYPEAANLLRHARVAAFCACKNNDFSGMYWKDSRRRLGTKSVRRLLDTTLANLLHAYLVINPDTGVPSFRTPQNFLWAKAALEDMARAGKCEFRYAAPVASTLLHAA